MAHIAGDVVVEVGVAPDGTIQSTEVVSGPPLLEKATLESAGQSQFECRNCDMKPRKVRLVYTYRLLPGDCCGEKYPAENGESSGAAPGVTQEGNHITVVDYPGCICDPAADVSPKIRSWKCLYLWKCAVK